MLLLENSFSDNNFTKISISRYNVYFIGLGNDCDTTINPSSQFHQKKQRKCCENVRLLNEKVYKMKSIIQINIRLINNIVEEREFSHDIPFSRNILMVPTVGSDLDVNFIKNIISNNNIEDESTFKRIIQSVKKLIKGTERQPSKNIKKRETMNRL